MNPEDAKTNDLKKYLQEVSIAEKEQRQYIERARNVVKRYRDEDRNRGNDDLPARYNILWSNTETMGPALYSHTPNVQVDRRFKDADPVGRVACQIWERATQFSIDNYDFDSVMKAVIKDYQLASRGTAWLRYEPGVVQDQIQYQEVLCDHVHFSDFFHSPARQWKAVRLVGRKIYLNRKQLRDRFGKKVGNAVNLDYSGRGADDEHGEERTTSDQEQFKQARIYEIWDSDNMKVIWLSKSYAENVLDIVDDPLGLRNFFPTPKPLFGTTTTETLIPIPDYTLYQDQARELDLVTMKISLLQDALRLVGVYDSSFEKLALILSDTKQNKLIPVDNWPKFASQGGFEGVMQWMSIKEIVEALGALYIQRKELKADLYEITGIADIIRGSSAPSETATAQQIKGQFATLRISDRQRDVERYARDLIALQGEIIAEHFEPETIAMMSGYDVSNPDVQQLFMPAIELLKSDPMRSFRIDIETDSMVAIDEALDKQKTTEFLQAFGGFLEGSAKAIESMPVLAPLMTEAMLYLVRRYHAGRGLETAIEQATQGMVAMAQQPKPDPEAAKMQGQMQLEQRKFQAQLQMQQQEQQFKVQLAQAEAGAKAQTAQAEMQQKAQALDLDTQSRYVLETQKNQQASALNREKLAGEMQLAAVKAEREIQLKAFEMQSHDKLETKKALLGSKNQSLHISADGSITTHPTIVKTGKFSFDPATGERTVTVVEQPVPGKPLSSGNGKESDEPATIVKTGRVKFDPATGDRTIEMVEQPVKSPIEATQGEVQAAT